MRRWDIYWANVPYEDDPTQSKRRPVVIAKDKTVYVLTIKVTSKDARNDPGDYSLQYWKESGLREPSVVRVSKISKLPRDAIDEYIGRVHAADANRIQEIMYELKGS